jgi:hypothetical protein
LTLAALASPLAISRDGFAARDRSAIILAGFVIAFLAIHLVVSFAVWDRYLLSIVPIMALLAGQTLSRLARVVRVHRPAWRALLSTGMIALLLGPAWRAAQSDYPIGGDHGAYDGIDQVAAFLRRMPWGSVLYDQALNWELGYYLYDGPVYVAWYGSPQHLVSDLDTFGKTGLPRFLIVPAWQSGDADALALRAARYRQDLVLTTFRRDSQVSFSVYRLTPHAHVGADGAP